MARNNVLLQNKDMNICCPRDDFMKAIKSTWHVFILCYKHFTCWKNTRKIIGWKRDVRNVFCCFKCTCFSYLEKQLSAKLGGNENDSEVQYYLLMVKR